MVTGRRRADPGGQERAQLAVGFIGAGNYASSMLLPHLAKMDTVRLAHVATNRSLSAANAQRRFGFATVSTSAEAVLGDSSLDAIFIVTRHHTHADLVCRALETGKAVFVEKPLALTREELDRILEAVERTGNDRLMVGFNRRFAPAADRAEDQFGPAGDSSVTRYLVNAGQLAADSWYTNEELEGSRFTGEGGHFIDTVTWWADSLPEEVYAVRGPDHDDVQAIIRMRSGASATITYVTGGNVRYPEGDAGLRGRRPERPAGQLHQGRVWTGAASRPRGRAAARTRASARAGGVHRGRPDRRGRCRSRWSPWSPRPAPPSRWRTAC